MRGLDAVAALARRCNSGQILSVHRSGGVRVEYEHFLEAMFIEQFGHLHTIWYRVWYTEVDCSVGRYVFDLVIEGGLAEQMMSLRRVETFIQYTTVISNDSLTIRQPKSFLQPQYQKSSTPKSTSPNPKAVTKNASKMFYNPRNINSIPLPLPHIHHN
jgi:hypothetical protein